MTRLVRPSKMRSDYSIMIPIDVSMYERSHWTLVQTSGWDGWWWQLYTPVWLTLNSDEKRYRALSITHLYQRFSLFHISSVFRIKWAAWNEALVNRDLDLAEESIRLQQHRHALHYFVFIAAAVAVDDRSFHTLSIGWRIIVKWISFVRWFRYFKHLHAICVWISSRQLCVVNENKT